MSSNPPFPHPVCFYIQKNQMQLILRFPPPRFIINHAKTSAFLRAASAPKQHQQQQPRPQSLSFRHYSSFASSMSGGTAAAAAETGAQGAEVANTSDITPASLSSTLTEKLEALYVDVEDISGE